MAAARARVTAEEKAAVVEYGTVVRGTHPEHSKPNGDRRSEARAFVAEIRRQPARAASLADSIEQDPGGAVSGAPLSRHEALALAHQLRAELSHDTVRRANRTVIVPTVANLPVTYDVDGQRFIAVRLVLDGVFAYRFARTTPNRQQVRASRLVVLDAARDLQQRLHCTVDGLTILPCATDEAVESFGSIVWDSAALAVRR